jgi:preprotein translocase subunit YajC
MALLLTMVVLFGVMWFLLIRPQQRKQQQQRAILESLVPGQEILTAGGLFGTITDVDIEEVVLEIAPGVNVRVDKRAVASVVEAEEVDDPYEAQEAPEPAEAEHR